MQNRYYHTNRRKYSLKAHIVLVTRYRKTLLQNGMDEFVRKSVNYPAEQNQWNIIAMETDKDHIHILLEYYAAERICDIIYIIRQRTIHWLWMRYKAFLFKHYCKKYTFWSDGYFACSIGEVSSVTIEKYIFEQG